MKEIVTFFLSGKEYGVDVSRLQGIENYEEMSGKTEMPDGFMGLVCVRNEMIPVLDIRKKLVLPSVPVTGDTKYVVLQSQRGKLAFVADGISRILQADGDEVQEFPGLLRTKKVSYGDFVVNHKGHLILVINPEALLSSDDWKKMEDVLKKKKEDE